MVIEDLDSCGLHEKNSKAGIFLDEIDDVNNDLNMVILVTINDTSRVHFSIINRPGRFDKVIEIKPPQSLNEIYDVMISKAKKLKRKYCPKSQFEIPDMTDLDHQCLQECLDREFTQAEITNAITEQIFIYISIMVSEDNISWNAITPGIFNKLLRDSIESHKKTQEAIKNCDFNNIDPTDGLMKEEISYTNTPTPVAIVNSIPGNFQ
jgi:SpoVK/Ycf46/Vps4 family AAA+-type ATPase